jgi:DNA-binding XRE family transcriptional regulator
MRNGVSPEFAKIREERGMSKSELARRADTTYQTILNIEQGRYEPGFRTMAKIARALGVSVEAFVDLDEEE